MTHNLWLIPNSCEIEYTAYRSILWPTESNMLKSGPVRILVMVRAEPFSLSSKDRSRTIRFSVKKPQHADYRFIWEKCQVDTLWHLCHQFKILIISIMAFFIMTLLICHYWLIVGQIGDPLTTYCLIILR